MTTAGITVIPAAGAGGETARARRLTSEAAALWQEFPPRVPAARWPATLAGRETVVREAMACPCAAGENDQSRYFRRLGVVRMLDWLEAQPGSAWQERWHAGCRAAADQDWRDTADRWLKDAGRIAAGNQNVWRSLGGALGLLIGCDVIRPDLGWLLAAVMMAVKGGQVGDITVGDCLELLEARARGRGDRDKGGTFFYQLLHAAGFLPAGAPARVRM